MLTELLATATSGTTSIGGDAPEPLMSIGVVGILVFLILREILPYVGKRSASKKRDAADAIASKICTIHSRLDGVNFRKWRSQDGELHSWHAVRDPVTGMFAWHNPQALAQMIHDVQRSVDDLARLFEAMRNELSAADLRFDELRRAINEHERKSQ